ncbi:MAG TPA: hypothetical protein PLN71_12640, partial [Anaerolineae bacterium]|nr:hypothetical protein [Anaerolineae bacterium]
TRIWRCNADLTMQRGSDDPLEAVEVAVEVIVASMIKPYWCGLTLYAPAYIMGCEEARLGV